MNIRAPPRLDSLYTRALKLKEFKKLYRYYKHLNKNVPRDQRKTIYNRKFFCSRAHIYDAEDFYYSKIQAKIKKIKQD